MWSWFCYCRTWWLLPSTTVKRGGVVGCQLEDGSFCAVGGEELLAVS
ncbi:hypothetical protein NC651_003175 [Populus alba x Populus x berolinensis]|nr:hypothetical protein NC651_003175 [Populus alba x Populus x berolinensis]